MIQRIKSLIRGDKKSETPVLLNCKAKKCIKHNINAYGNAHAVSLCDTIHLVDNTKYVPIVLGDTARITLN